MHREGIGYVSYIDTNARDPVQTTNSALELGLVLAIDDTDDQPSPTSPNIGTYSPAKPSFISGIAPWSVLNRRCI